MKKDGGPAFPEKRRAFVGAGQFGEAVTQYETVSGMTLRDYFAGQALQGFLSGIAGLPSMDDIYEQGSDRVFREHAEMVARTMYGYADAMIAERERE